MRRLNQLKSLLGISLSFDFTQAFLLNGGESAAKDSLVDLACLALLALVSRQLLGYLGALIKASLPHSSPMQRHREQLGRRRWNG